MPKRHMQLLAPSSWRFPQNTKWPKEQTGQQREQKRQSPPNTTASADVKDWETTVPEGSRQVQRKGIPKKCLHPATVKLEVRFSRHTLVHASKRKDLSKCTAFKDRISDWKRTSGRSMPKASVDVAQRVYKNEKTSCGCSQHWPLSSV